MYLVCALMDCSYIICQWHFPIITDSFNAQLTVAQTAGRMFLWEHIKGSCVQIFLAISQHLQSSFVSLFLSLLNSKLLTLTFVLALLYLSVTKEVRVTS